MADDPRDVWSRPHGQAPASPGVEAPPGPGATPESPQMTHGNWWYQYPTGQWIRWSPERNEWVTVAGDNRSTMQQIGTPWWVYALITIAILGVIAIITGIVVNWEEIANETNRLQNEINV